MEADEFYYWCFICQKECFIIESDEGELQCDKCLSTFVEELPNKNQNSKMIDLNNNIIIREENNLENTIIRDMNNISEIDLNQVRNTNTYNIQTDNRHPNINNHQVIGENVNNNNLNLIDINYINQNAISNNNNSNLSDDPRNFVPILNNNINNIGNISRANNGITSITFNNQGGNALVQMQISGLNTNQNNQNGNYLNNQINNYINSIFSSLSGNNNFNNNINISNNQINFNLNGLLGDQANSLIQGFQNINFNSFLGRNFNDNAFENLLNIIMRNDNGTPPASEEVIQRLERITIKKENFEKYNKETCIICADDFLLEQKLIDLYCNHFFHEECIVTWLRKRNQCPICRKELKTDDIDYEYRRSQSRSILNNLVRNNQNDNNNNNNGNGDMNI